MSIRNNVKVVKLLLWKSWKIRVHYKKCFIALFVLPLIFPALFTLFYKYSGTYWYEYSYGNGSYAPPIYSEPKELFNVSFYSNYPCYGWYCFANYTILYTPDNNYTSKVMKNVEKIFVEKAADGKRRAFNIKPMENEYEIRKKVRRYYYNSDAKIIGGVSFQNMDIGDTIIPKNINYDIIVDEYVASPNLYRYVLNYAWRDQPDYRYISYIDRKFVALQAAVDIAHLRLLMDQSLNVNTFLQFFPLPGPNKSYSHYDMYTVLIASSFAISLLFIFPVSVKRIVEEKSTRVKEYLTCCGVKPGFYWTTTHLDTFSLIAIQTLALILIYTISIRAKFPTYSNSFDRYGHIAYISIMEIMNASFFLLLIVFILYCIQTTLFASFLTIFFENANVAAAVSIVACVMTATYPCYSMFAQFDSLPYSALFPNCALFWVIYVFKGRHYFHEETNGFSNLFENSRWGNNLTTAQVLFFMLLSSFIYAFLTWYLTEIWPWQRGVSKSWYFPFAKQYNKYILKKETNCDSHTDKDLVIEKISKNYDSSKKVLNKVSFEIDKNSLSVLLGPNGSGKSTLINIICGLADQTEGNVFVKGNNTDDNLEMAQSFLGFCPQHNTFFKHLTIHENLHLIYELKQALRERVDGYKVEEVVEMLSLQQFAHQITNNLSGGVLRRLTLAMSMVGPSDVLVIDEPTESLDPMAKRSVWDMLVKSRETKTILVCSHQLDEVNVIADKVAVLIYGELKCIKTTLELKKEYGMGYTLRIKKNPEFLTNEKIHFTISEHSKQLTNEKYSPDSEELVFHIPFNECNTMPTILKELERNQFNWGIESMSLFATTLEDVYTKMIANESNGKDSVIEEWNFDKSGNEEISVSKTEGEQNLMKLIIGQFQWLFLKNLFYNMQHLTLLIIFIVIPLLIILTIFIAARIIVRIHASYLLDHFSLTQDMYGSNTHSFVDSDENSFINAYKSVSNGVQVYSDKSLELQDWLLKIADHDLIEYYKKFLFGASFTEIGPHEINLTVWMNPSSNHGPPISLNTAMNALFRAITQKNDYSITVTNKWITQKSDFDREFNYQYSEEYDFILFPTSIAIYALCYSAYIIRPVVERSLGFTHSQLMTGVQPIVYWSSHLIFDLLLNFICSTIHIICFYLLDTQNVFTGSHYYLPSMFAVFFMAGFSQIPFMYTFSFIFKNCTSAYLFMAVFCIIVGLPLVPIATAALNIFKFNVTKILILFPFITFPYTLSSLYKAFAQETICDRVGDTRHLSFCMSEYSSYITNRICCPNLCYENTTVWMKMQNCTFYPNPFFYETGHYTIITLMVFMLISGLLYFTITNLLEYNTITGFLSNLYAALKRSVGISVPYISYDKAEAEDVIAEANYVNQVTRSNQISQESLVIQELTKQFDSLRIPNKMNLTVRKGECLGLLGGNACGKTTTFKLLTSQMKPTFGNAFINDLDTNLTGNTAKYLSYIGYCPQNDTLLDCLTGLQTLKLFMKLRGKDNRHEMETLIDKFHLRSVIKQRVSTYSGGNRRKLSLALALIGNQKLLLLDEPTNGVDPCSRNKVWQLLRNISETFQVSILITSHNMQEVETLCDRIAVMSSGKLQCIGSMVQLREKYGKGFNLTIKVEREMAESKEKLSTVKQAIDHTFTDETLSLKYDNFGVLYYSLISNSVTLSHIFEKLELIRDECKLEDYIVSNANLEQNLLLFMKNN